ncbi:BamA/TamA family outer membrane protein [Persicobacter psychrovividus]|uniref:Membrane protein n=1 Tax=Persicobacter psychrovividus TaxID=387638 RepID=A0ABN6LCE6_9BACT|nr:membrane protein [Persicobacter psychrovividus]
MIRSNIGLTAIIALFFFSACSGLKYVPKGQKLYESTDFDIHFKNRADSDKDLEGILQGLVPLEPNTKFGISRPALWLHYIVKEPKKEKGLKYFLKYRLGEKPVYVSDIDWAIIDKKINYQLQDRGFFNHTVSRDSVVKKKTTTVKYSIQLGKATRLGKIERLSADQEIKHSLLRPIAGRTAVDSAKVYHYEDLELERSRLADSLKNRGFYYFSPEYIHYVADTLRENKVMDLDFELSQNIPDYAYKKYRISNVYIYDYHNAKDSVNREGAQQIGPFKYVNFKNYVNPKVLEKGILIRPDTTYNYEASVMSSQRLMGLGTYRFVNIRYEPNPQDSMLLDANIYLTPRYKKSLQLELEGTSKSNNFIGPGLNLNYINRNAFGGAELLKIRPRFSFESQYGTDSSTVSYDLQLDASLEVPQIWAPFPIASKSAFLPKTKIGANLKAKSIQSQVLLFSAETSYGYKWRSKAWKFFEWDPMFVNYIIKFRTSPEFEEVLDNNIRLKRSLQNQLILGTRFNYTYNELLKSRKKPIQFYMSLNFEMAGNLLHLLNTGTLGADKADNPMKIFDVPYSQYVKFAPDFRLYFNLRHDRQWILRAFGGIAQPYGNSSSVPFVKQFYGGGPNDLRSFRSWGIGPGGYRPDENNSVSLDRSGELKLGFNAEYRFPMISVIKGAWFVDAGNIWTLEKQDSFPFGEFTFDHFYKQIGMSAGFGLRADIQGLFVIRFDFATTVLSPKGNGSEWMLNQVNPLSGTWRRNNLLLNFAIGYPF